MLNFFKLLVLGIGVKFRHNYHIDGIKQKLFIFYCTIEILTFQFLNCIKTITFHLKSFLNGKDEQYKTL